MIGAARLDDEGAVQQWSALDAEPAGRAALFEDFLASVRATPNAVLCSWSTSNFDPRGIALGLAHWAPHLLGEWNALPPVNLLLERRRRIALPVERTWALDSAAVWAGYTRPADAHRGEDAWDGFAIGAAYDHYQSGSGPRQRRDAPFPLAPILRKNARDILQMAYVARVSAAGALPCIEGSQTTEDVQALAAFLAAPPPRHHKKRRVPVQ